MSGIYGLFTKEKSAFEDFEGLAAWNRFYGNEDCVSVPPNKRSPGNTVTAGFSRFFTVKTATVCSRRGYALRRGMTV